VMVSVIYAECHNNVHYAECRYAELCEAECRGAVPEQEPSWVEQFMVTHCNKKLQSYFNIRMRLIYLTHTNIV
jgi:hypothetical protein